MAPHKQAFHVVVSLSALMLGETLRPSVGKWNNTFNHMKQSTQDYFCTYFLSLFPLSLNFSLSLCLSLQFYSLSLPRTHTYTYILAPANEHRYKQGISPKSSLHTYTQTHTVDNISQNKAYHSGKITPLHIPTKTYHYKTVQYNYNCFYRELCELLLVINILSLCLCVNLGVFDKHTSVSACVREEHLRAPTIRPEPVTVTHSPPLSLPFIL